MQRPEHYWAYKQSPIPEVSDLPEGTFKGNEDDWGSLSPGMRRMIWREATKSKQPIVPAGSVDDERLKRADEKHRQSEAQILAREAL